MSRPARPASPTLDTGHSLYSALVGLWYNTGGGNMVDALATLTLAAAGGAGTASGSYGDVGRCDAADEAFGATAAAGHKVTEGCVAWYGVPIGAGSAFASVFGITYDAGESNPFLGLTLAHSGTTSNVMLGFNNGGGGNFHSVGDYDWSAKYGTDTTAIGNFATGAQEILVDGVSRGTGTNGSVINYGTNPVVQVGPFSSGESGRNSNIDTILALMLSRPMTSPEISAFDADPWEILRAASGGATAHNCTLLGVGS